MIPILDPSPENLDRAAAALRRGGVVGMPTETVYGLAGSAFNPIALARIFEVKRRPFFDPLIVHVAERARVDDLCARLPPDAEALMARFWPGPLTLVLPKRPAVPDLATAGLPTVALRMPAHPAALALLRAAGPLAAPSANPFGGLSPTTAAHVAAALGDGVDCVLDGGPCAVGVESTVLGWNAAGEPVLLRAGGVVAEDLAETLGRRPLPPAEPSHPSDAPASAPGQMPWHYAPRTPLSLWPENASAVPASASSCGLLWFGPHPPAGFVRVENLSPAGDLRAAAAELFAALHRLDAAGCVRIYARLLPERGLGRAVNDRLRKAAAAPRQP